MASQEGGDFPSQSHLQQNDIPEGLAWAAKVLRVNTCSGLRPGGTQAYSSRAQPESSSEVEFLWKSYMSLVTVFSISTGMAVTACSSRRHLQCTQIFLPDTQKQKAPVRISDERRLPSSHWLFNCVIYDLKISIVCFSSEYSIITAIACTLTNKSQSMEVHSGWLSYSRNKTSYCGRCLGHRSLLLITKSK